MTIPLFSQQEEIIRIGVANALGGTGRVKSGDVTEQLVKVLNQHRREKKGKASIEAIPLNVPPGGRALSEAAKQKCDFVLYSRIRPVAQSAQVTQSGDGSVFTKTPVFSAEMEYVLKAVNSESHASGLVKSPESSSDKEATLEAANSLGKKVVLILNKGEFESEHNEEVGLVEETTPVAPPLTADIAPEGRFCEGLGSFAHVDVLAGVCEYAITLPEKMPNFVCQQQTSRYEGRNHLPNDLITATVRYEDGDESYSDIKRNGKPDEDLSHNQGLWSNGQFEGNLRSVFHMGNHPVFDFAGEQQSNGRATWVFTFRVAHQIDPLWRMRVEDQVLAPAYEGEIWVDKKTGEIVRFRSAAKDLPAKFPIQNAEVDTQYGNVEFGDGTSFVLPVSSTIATQFQGMEPTRNVVEFHGCHKFRAKAHMVLNVPGEDGSENAAGADLQELRTQLDENETIYAIARQDAVREDEARLQAEHNIDLSVATVAMLWKIASLEKQRESVIAKEAARARESSAAQNLPTYKVKVNLVPVSVVTRDRKGQAVGTLTKENFRLFDERKPQVITRFSVEKDQEEQASGENTNPADIETSAGVQLPSRQNTTLQTRNIAYIFDDLHTSFEDMANAVKAAEREFAEMRAQDRAAIFTTSGDVVLDFTADREKLQAALKKVKAHPLAGWNCPPMNYYEADLIVNHADSEAGGQAVADAMDCAHPGTAVLAERLAKSRALEVATEGRVASEQSFKLLDAVIGGMTPMTGLKSIVLVSPGFLALTREAQDRTMTLIDRALQAGVVVNTLDVSGLSTNMSATLNRPGSMLDEQENTERNAMMADLAYGTGGTFFHNNNDLNDGFRRTAELPEYIYVLGFSPQKLDGKFHRLKVTLNAPDKLSVQARPGYYAVKPSE